MQHIDLQPHQSREPRLNARQLVSLLAFAIALAVAWSAWQATTAQTRQQELATVRADVARADQALQAFRRANPDVADNSELTTAIERLQQQRSVRQQLLANLQRSAGQRGVSYFGFMEALASQRLDGVWLTGFGLDNRPGTDRLRVMLAGEAERAELLPHYLDRLRTSRPGGEDLVGLTFNNLDLQRLPADADHGLARYRFHLRTEAAGAATRTRTAAEQWGAQ